MIDLFYCSECSTIYKTKDNKTDYGDIIVDNKCIKCGCNMKHIHCDEWVAEKVFAIKG